MREEWTKLEERLASGHGVVSAQEARAAGVSRHALGWALRQGRLTALRRGVYTSAARWERASPEHRHVLRLIAHQRVHPYSSACSVSAAVAMYLPTPHGPPPEPMLTVARRAGRAHRPAGRGHQAGAVRRSTHLLSGDVWLLSSGVRVLSAPRTVLDCARIWSPAWGLALADAAVFTGLATCSALVERAGQGPPAPGWRHGEWVAAHAREKVESPLESLARATIVLAGLPEPTPQVSIDTRRGRYRVDLLDERHRLITEADGRLKYLTGDDLWQEKRREDALREAGYRMIRFAMSDHRAPAAWVAAYRRMLVGTG